MVLDLQRRLLMRNNSVVHLLRLEYQMVRAPAGNGRRVTHERLLCTVTDYEDATGALRLRVSTCA
jgi:hypothetical protein